MPDLAFTQSRQIAEPGKPVINFTTVICDSCLRAKITNLNLISLLYLSKLICHKCEDKTSKQTNKQLFLERREIEGAELNERIVNKQ